MEVLRAGARGLFSLVELGCGERTRASPKGLGQESRLLTHRLPGYCEPSEMREEEGLQERGGAFAPPAGRPLFLEAVGVLYNLLTSC